ncbi:MAG: GFA family protein [Fimbriimonadaceae bacterium]|nr:GFA family protein [Alphaproteobacteria bacterium]
MITGNCLCGTVRWQAETPFIGMAHCHCSMCRKAHGASVVTWVIASRDNFSFVSGENRIKHYESSPGFMRAFCGDCGSSVPEPRGDKPVAMPAGCLNEDPGLRPTAHIFVPSKAPWTVINDDLRQFNAYPGQDKEPDIERRESGSAKDGVLHGSCLCGDVAYEISAPIKAVHNCHCGRCRKARAAAFATNGFTEIGGVSFTRGEDRLKIYKLPTAKFFTHVFCAKCGSDMPRLDVGRGIAIIPFGSLDEDPGRGGDDHVFVGSMATWDEITDDLLRFDEMPG